MSLKTRALTDIAAELHSRYALAHVSTATALDIARAELDGAKTMLLDARAAVVAAMTANDFERARMWVAEAEAQYQRGCALNALCKRLEAAEIEEEANALAAGAKRAA